MSDDLLDTMFKDLDVFYPGSKKKRQSNPKKETAKEVYGGWDSKPYKKTLPNGKDIEMFTVGALAAALGRPFVSVRVWNKEGYLPPAPYRLPTKQNKNGELHKGRRLYSRAMIEAAVALFEARGLLESRRIDWVEHRTLSTEIADTWTKIKMQETEN
jgi:hypothetical protein